MSAQFAAILRLQHLYGSVGRITWLPSSSTSSPRRHCRQRERVHRQPPQRRGNAAPLALAAFAVTTFMLSMINAGLVPAATEPVVFGVALMFGGLTQLIAGLIVLRGGNTFGGVLFCGFGAFWLSLFAIAQFFLKDIPPAQAGHALRPVRVRVRHLYRLDVRRLVPHQRRGGGRRLADLVAVFAVLGSGLYAGNAGLVKTGGWLGSGGGGTRRVPVLRRDGARRPTAARSCRSATWQSDKGPAPEPAAERGHGLSGGSIRLTALPTGGVLGQAGAGVLVQLIPLPEVSGRCGRHAPAAHRHAAARPEFSWPWGSRSSTGVNWAP